MFINDQLNLNRKQIASIKRTFANNKATYNKMSKVKYKIERLAAEFKELEALTLAWEAPIKAMTSSACGVELTSEQVLTLLKNPELIKNLESYTAEETSSTDAEAPFGN